MNRALTTTLDIPTRYTEDEVFDEVEGWFRKMGHSQEYIDTMGAERYYNLFKWHVGANPHTNHVELPY